MYFLLAQEDSGAQPPSDLCTVDLPRSCGVRLGQTGRDPGLFAESSCVTMFNFTEAASERHIPWQ